MAKHGTLGTIDKIFKPLKLNKGSKGKEVKPIWGLYWPYIILFKRKVHLGHFPLLILICVFIYRVSSITFTKIGLAEKGEVTRGFIYNSEKVGGKGTVEYYYSYKIGNEILNGRISNGNYSKKDSIDILYDKNHPEISWPLKEIEKDHPEKLKANLSYSKLKKKNGA